MSSSSSTTTTPRTTSAAFSSAVSFGFAASHLCCELARCCTCSTSASRRMSRWNKWLICSLCSSAKRASTADSSMVRRCCSCARTSSASRMLRSELSSPSPSWTRVTFAAASRSNRCNSDRSVLRKSAAETQLANAVLTSWIRALVVPKTLIQASASLLVGADVPAVGNPQGVPPSSASTLAPAGKPPWAPAPSTSSTFVVALAAPALLEPTRGTSDVPALAAARFLAALSDTSASKAYLALPSKKYAKRTTASVLVHLLYRRAFSHSTIKTLTSSVAVP